MLLLVWPYFLAYSVIYVREFCCFQFTGIVAQLPQELSNFLTQVQGKLSKVIKSVGKIDHELYPFR